MDQQSRFDIGWYVLASIANVLNHLLIMRSDPYGLWLYGNRYGSLCIRNGYLGPKWTLYLWVSSIQDKFWIVLMNNFIRYGRIETLSGFANGIFLILISIFIMFEAIQRMLVCIYVLSPLPNTISRLEPPEMNTNQLLLVSSLGLAVNLFGMFAMGGHHHHVCFSLSPPWVEYLST